MRSAAPFPAWADPGGDDDGCAYIVENGHAEPCGKPRRRDSSYCQAHHAQCHLPIGSLGERSRLREIAVLADAVGRPPIGRKHDPDGPSPHFLRALERRIKR